MQYPSNCPWYKLTCKIFESMIFSAHPWILPFILRAPWWLVSFAFQCILSTLKNPPSWLYHKCIFEHRAVHTAKHYQSNIQIRNLSLFELLPMYLFCFFPRPNLEQIITERKLSYIWVNGAAFDGIFSFLDYHLFLFKRKLLSDLSLIFGKEITPEVIKIFQKVLELYL